MAELRRYAILEAPSILGLRPSGVERLPEAMRRHGLVERIGARHAGRVQPPPYRAERDPETRTLNAHGIAAYSPRLADAVERVLDAGDFPVILGGDCSILLGSMLALRRRGRFGLLYLDGHADFYQPEVNPNGEAASMDLAFATGRGPRLLTDLEGRMPLVRDDDVCMLGYRDLDEQRHYGSQALPPNLLAFDVDAVHQLGADHAARAAVAHLTRDPLDGFLVHLDADCLADEVMPAVDYRLPGGLSLDELRAVLSIALRSLKVVGLELTIYNPSLDPTGHAGQRLADALVTALVTGP